MKIIHTADWHIGKKLYKHDLIADFQEFINWFICFIEEEKIDLVLVSGDIFDVANPSIEARRVYYETLVKLYNSGCKVIITAGNHDSPMFLTAPKELLKKLNISIVGHFSENVEENVFLVEKSENQEKILIAAVPYLPDNYLRKLSDTISYEDKIKAIQQGIERVYLDICHFCREKYPNIPILAMGHLFATGDIIRSEDEREIQVGNEARFDLDRISAHFSYIALGHIHKPQKLNCAVPAFYSGSPIPLSFSEKKDTKRILLIDTEKTFQPESIQVPSFRKLQTLKGTLEEIKNELPTLSEKNKLPNLLEIHLVEKQYSLHKEEEFLRLINEFQHPNYEIAKHRMDFQDRVLGSSELFSINQNLSEISPSEVFQKLLDTQSDMNEEFRKELLYGFSILQEEVKK